MLKACIQFCFLCLAAIPWLWWRGCSIFLGRERALLGVSQLIALWPGISGGYYRAAFYRLAFPGSPQDTAIGFMTTFSNPNAVLHAHVSTGVFCNIGWAEIGEHCILGSHVCIASGKKQHLHADTGMPIRLQGGVKEKVTIGRDCWIGNGSVVLANVGEGSVVAAGSVVVHHVRPFSIVGGNPARMIASRLESDPPKRTKTRRKAKE